MSFSDEFVRRLASVKCSDHEHPIRPVFHSVDDLAAFGYQAPMSSRLSPEQEAESNRRFSVYRKELTAQCLFCIARATIERAGESPVTSLTCTSCNGGFLHTGNTLCPECKPKILAYGPASPEKGWSDQAHIALDKLVSKYRDMLTKKAVNFSRGNEVTEKDVINGHQSVWDR